MAPPVRVSFEIISFSDLVRKTKRFGGRGVVGVWLAVSLCFSVLLYHTTHFSPVLLLTRGDEEVLIWRVFTLIFSVFFASIWKDPGTVSFRYAPTLIETRYLPSCQTCGNFKAPRSGHCFHCGYCIQRRDHHCPWINNCVGFNNERIFFFFLIVVVTTSHLTTYWLSLLLLNHTCLSSLPPFPPLSSLSPSSFPQIIENITTSCPLEEINGRQTLLFLTFVFDVGILLSVTWLVLYQASLVLTNMTTIEDLLISALDRAVEKKGEEKFAFVYDVGLRENLGRLWGESGGWFLYSLLFPLLDERLDYCRATKWPTKEGHCQFQTEIFRKYYDMSLAHPKFLRGEIEKFISLTEKKMM